MIKISRDGRKRSVTTWREALSMVDALKLNLTDEEKALVLALYEDVEYGYEDVERDMVGHIFHTEPVSMAQFMEDPYYLGESCTTLYPELHKDLISLFDRPYREVVFTGGIGVGKCVAGDTEIYDPVHGRRMTAAEMAILGGGIGCASYDKNLGGMRAAECSAEASGVKMTGRLKVRSGRSVRLSLDHPVLTPYGWKVVSELSRGDLVASARRLPAPVSPLPVSDDEVKWVAYMLADGGTTTGSMTFTNESLRVLSEFESVTTRLGTGVSFVRMDGKATTLRPLEMQWARKKYNLGKKAIEKRVPAEFYGLDDRQLGLFLNRVWACDGWVCKRSGDHWEIGISLGSEEFIRDIQQLLLRFGINARVRQRKMKYTHKGEQRSSDAWSLQVLGADDIVVFLDSVGMVRGKEGVCQSALAAAGSIVSNSNVDITPMNREVMTRLRKEIGPLPKRAYWPRPAQWSQMGNKVFRVFAANYTLPGWCRWWGDVFWDVVEGLEETGVAEPVYDLSVPGTENFAPYGLIIHNTFCLSIAICRIIYELSCMINPQKTFGLSSGSEMVIPMISKNLVLAREIMKTAVDDKIKESPYFMTLFAPKVKKDYTLFPNNIRLTIGSYGSDRILGANVFTAALDETNFPPRRRAQQIAVGFGQKLKAAHFDIVEKMYRGLLRRIKSRFQKAGGGFPGMVILASSAATTESFTERKMREAMTDPEVFVRDHTQWTAKPGEHFSGELFYVLCSRSATKSRILREDEYELITDEWMEANDAFVMDIPIEFKEDFEANMEDSLRDIAGFATEAISQYIQRPKMIQLCTDTMRKHPFSVEEWGYGSPAEMDWEALTIEFERNLPGGFTEKAWKPRRNPSAMRWCHIDVGVSGDSAGFCVGHIERYVEVVRTDIGGHKSTDLAPYYVVDFMLRINPPPAEQIFLPDLRSLFYMFLAHGYQFIGFSSDRYEHVEMHQQIRRKGVATHLISMDIDTEAYDELKGAFYEQRIEVYEYPPFVQEFKKLEYDRLDGKIDHPLAGSKDVSDSVAGVVLGLKRASERMPVLGKGEKQSKPSHPHTWVTEKIPAELVDITQVKALKEGESDEEFMPILFGD